MKQQNIYHQGTKYTKVHQEKESLSPDVYRQDSNIFFVYLCVLCVFVVNLFTSSSRQTVSEEADEFLDPLLQVFRGGALESQGHVQGRNGRGLQEAVEHRVQEE